jgi:hypothetical protein
MTFESTRMSISDAKASNANFIQAYHDEDRGQMNKIAADSNMYFRMMVRTDGILRSLMPVETVTSADFSAQANSDDAVIVRMVQTDSAGSYSVPFNGAPQRQTIRAPRYTIGLHRILTTKYAADELMIATYDMPIVEMKTDLLKKDFLAQEDTKYVSHIDTSCGLMYNGENYAQVQAGLHYQRTKAAGYLGLDSVSTGQGAADGYAARRALMSIETAMSFNKPTTANVNSLLMNTVTYQYFKYMLDRNTAGGDIAQSFIFEKGEYENLGSARVIKTLNRNLIADNVIYAFSTPQHLGSFVVYQDITVDIKHESYFFSFFAHGVEGLGIANLACAKKVKLGGWTGAGTPDWTVTPPASV